MDNLRKFYIDGAWVEPDSTKTMPIINPATEATIGTVALGNATDVDRAVAAASRAFESWGLAPKSERLALLERIKTATEARFEDLAQAMREEMGAPIKFAREAQADAAIGHLQGFIDALSQLEEETDLESLPSILALSTEGSTQQVKMTWVTRIILCLASARAFAMAFPNWDSLLG